MKTTVLIALCGLSVSLHAAEGDMPQGSEPESTLARVEIRISKLNSGREHLLAGFASLKPNLKQIACKAVPSAADAIALIHKDIAHLEEPEIAAVLTEQQKGRLAAQKILAASLSPKIDCTTIQ